MIGKKIAKKFADSISWRVSEAVLREIPRDNSFDVLMREVNARSTGLVKLAQRDLFLKWQEMAQTHQEGLASVYPGFRVFSQFDEDGVLLFILAASGMKTKRFLDIGCGDCAINSNVANLVFNWGYSGVGLDGNGSSIVRARKIHERHADTWAYPSRFAEAMIKRENVNGLVREAGLSGEIDVLSVDIDGNDYWIWDALDVVDPRIVIIETHVEFGRRSIVVPYDADYVYPGGNEHYFGASVPAMIKLAKRKGYVPVGSNIYGFNTVYVRADIKPKWLREWTVEDFLSHPRNADRFALVEPIANWKYIEV